ncbi:MAG: hypothetical protein WAU53_07315 [Rhodoplanes sp.]
MLILYERKSRVTLAARLVGKTAAETIYGHAGGVRPHRAHTYFRKDGSEVRQANVLTRDEGRRTSWRANYKATCRLCSQKLHDINFISLH